MNSLVESGFGALTEGLGCLKTFGRNRLYNANVAEAQDWVCLTHEQDNFMVAVSNY